MLLNLIFIIVGIVLVLWGADRLTEGSVAVAERMNIPQIVIGLTVVAMGTSMPEFCVSLISALKGTPDLAVGNVVGSNIFNSLFIVGITAAIAPMAILRATVMKDIPFALVASVMLLMMCLDGRIGRIDAAILFSLFMIFMFMTLKSAKINKQELEEENKLAEKALKSVPKMSPAMSVVWILAGLACLIGGSTLFVEGASKLATSLGVSEAVVGLTIVAGGTSLPELATSIVSARKGSSGIAIGNVLGSNVFNILGILGVTGLICPMQLQGITDTDLSMLVISMIMIWFFSFTKYIIERWEGLILSATFIGYIAYLISHA